MKNIRYIAIVISLIVLVAHLGCMSTKVASPGAISGTVTDVSGNSLSGVTVSTTEAETVSDVYGKWMLKSLKPQITEVMAKHEKYQSQSLKIEVVSGQTIDNVNFILAADGELNTIFVNSLSSTKVKISFNSKYASKGYIEYGTGGILDVKTPEESIAKYSHEFEISNLVPASTYRYRCVIVDEYGRTVKSEIRTFTTNYTARPNPPANLKVNKMANSSAVQLTWDGNTDTDFLGYNVYRSSSNRGPFTKINSSSVPQSSFGDSGLEPGTKYYYKVTKLSGGGDESTFSSVDSILMPGYLTKNTAWTEAESPYVLTGDLTIAPNSSLVINQGVTVQVADYDLWDNDVESGKDLIEISVYGTLMIQGTSAAPVSIISNAPILERGAWNGIIFKQNADLSASIVKGLHLHNAINGLLGEAGGPIVRDSGFYNCLENGIKYVSGNSNIMVRNVSAENCAVGIEIAGYSAGRVQIFDSVIKNCFDGIVCKNNITAEVENNKIYRTVNTGISVANTNTASKVRLNTIGWGASGVGILCGGKDEVRRNTVHSNICIEALETCSGIFRSNLLLADKKKNSVGFLYNASKAYSSVAVTEPMTIEYNAIWDAATAVKKYANAFDGSALVGYSNDFYFTDMLVGPGLQGGNPFTPAADMNFIYVPAVGSVLFGSGYDYDTIGAENVPN